jgi:hypothetical protein
MAINLSPAFLKQPLLLMIEQGLLLRDSIPQLQQAPFDTFPLYLYDLHRAQSTTYVSTPKLTSELLRPLTTSLRVSWAVNSGPFVSILGLSLVSFSASCEQLN